MGGIILPYTAECFESFFEVTPLSFAGCDQWEMKKVALSKSV